ncbi:hypothetical protein EYF80_039300 [Liparis tanakae]|uniref:Uncharacterized protein n=1 Tax=Liparis tanakae TaxID=230148 RepID=A0A4Z2GB86_9TELE|nr:hypothetical protein EYF80_039300 [Liparis tanakae]
MTAMVTMAVVVVIVAMVVTVAVVSLVTMMVVVTVAVIGVGVRRIVGSGALPPHHVVLVVLVRRPLAEPCGTVLQQQSRDLAVGEGVPVDAVPGAMLQGKAELEVEVQHVQPVGAGQSTAEEVGLDHVVAEVSSRVRNLRRGRRRGQRFKAGGAVKR